MKKFKVGLQLYSIRDKMAEDMDAALKAVKEMGYTCVEFAGFYNYSAEEVKAMLDKYELTAISVHQRIDLFLDDPKGTIEYFKTIGAKYAVIPWYPAEKLKGTEEWMTTFENFMAYGKALKENGIQLLYHNHDFEFNKFEGKYLLDWLYEEIPAECLQPQIDTCWVHYAGEDPAAYMRKYSGRLEVLHLKDFECEKLGAGPVYSLIGNSGEETEKPSQEETGFRFRPVGYGIQNFNEILAAAEETGVEYVIVEQDSSYDTPTLETAKMSREYLKTLGL